MRNAETEAERVARARQLVAEREQAARSVKRNMSTQLECPGCKSGFEEPRVLACSHTYCKRCMERLVKKAQQGKKSETVYCPECGVPTEIPNGDITKLTYNFSIQHVTDLMKYYSSPEPVPVIQCGSCRRYGNKDASPAVARCSSCSMFLCKECFDVHSLDDFTKLHTTLTLTERRNTDYFFSCLTPDEKGIRNCQNHNWRPYTHFCITCSKGVCDRCIQQDHRSHVYSKPELIRPDYACYSDVLNLRTGKLLWQTEYAIDTVQDLMSGVQLLAATQIEEVVRTQEALSSALESRQSQLLQEIERLHSQDKCREPAENEDGTSG